MPGDMLAVKIIAIEPEDIGNTGIFNSDYSTKRLLGDNCETHYKIVRINDGFIEYSERLKLRVKPMIGLIATAPAKETQSSSRASRLGGNMDIQEVCAGTTVYLPVEIPGALLHIGDTHAIQGDGEIGGIECRSKVVLQVFVLPKPVGMEWVRLENEKYIMTAAFHEQTDEAFYEAYGEMIRWIVSDYGYTKEEAFMLIGQVLESRNTQFINPTRSYICKVGKEFLSDLNN
jgi:acetamidase/formamidase